MHQTRNAPLAPLTTLRLGGPADRLVTCESDEDIVATVQRADAEGTPLLIIAGGSNLVIADAGFPGTVLRIATTGHHLDGPELELAAGENWSAAVARAVEAGLAGIECLAGIPGSAGATPIQNVGAYGQEISDVLTEVDVYDREARARLTLPAADCGFAYRHSRFKADPGRFVVLRVRLALKDTGGLSAPIRYPEAARLLGVAPGAQVPAAAAREAVLKLRTGKGMVLDPEDHDTWSAGSFFTNPVLEDAAFAEFTARAARRLGPDAVPPAYPAGPGRTKTSAAWLIDRAGFTKGYGTGQARISGKHTLALTNRGGARTADLLALAREVRDGVRAAFGITLVNEPVMVGVQL